jgi:1-acyl-sn-glycerol-3-phosphate acyltransferase
MLRSLLVVTTAILYIVLVGFPFVLYGILTRNDGIVYRMGVIGVKLVLRAAGVRVDCRQCSRLDPGQTYVFMSNHVGNADPLALVACLPRVAALAKHVLFRVPVLGQALYLTGFIPVVRGTAEAAEAVDAGVSVLRSGRSLMVFPEGTRSKTGELLPFRRGVFLMAIRAGVPVVPVTVTGSREVMRKGDPRIHPGTIVVLIHDPIPTTGLTEHDRHALAERVRDVIAQGTTCSS